MELLRLIGAEGAVLRESPAYVEVIFPAMPLTFLFFAFRASLQGAGDTRTAMWLMALSAIVTVVIDPFFVLGWEPFPATGTRGAGRATFVSRALVTITGVAVSIRGGSGVRLYPRDPVPDRSILRRLVAVVAAVSVAPEPTIGAFVDDPAVIAESRRFLWVIAPF